MTTLIVVFDYRKKKAPEMPSRNRKDDELKTNFSKSTSVGTSVEGTNLDSMCKSIQSDKNNVAS